MKLSKRSLSMIVAIILCATMAIGSTLAYLTDTDESINTMVLGNVDIQQNEVFAQNSLLMPSVMVDGVRKNTIQKEVSVENTGKNDAFVRTVFGFEMGSLSPEEFLRYVGTEFSENVDTEWSDVEKHGMITVSGQNYYMMSTVRNEKLAPGAESGKTLMKVWLDELVDRKEIEAVDGNGDGELTVIVLTQGVQVEGFADAKTALDKAFQTLSAPDSHPWTNLNLDDINDASYWYEENPEADVFEIKTGAQLAYFAELINSKKDNFAGDTILLTADVDMAGIDWDPINSWDPENSKVLTFDGQGHSIKNLTFDGGSEAGFFGAIARDMIIKDVTFENANIVTSGSAAGVVIGAQYGDVTLDNVDVKNANVITTAEKGIRLGGLVGHSFLHDGATLTVKNCDVSGTVVTGYHNVAGLVGTLNNYDDLTSKWSMTNNTVTGCTITNTNGNEKHVSVYAVEGANYPHTTAQSNEYFTALGNTESGNTVTTTGTSSAPTVNVATAAQLYTMLTTFTDAGSGNSTINITADIEFKAGEQWTPVVIDGYNGAGVVTINGNGHTIDGLNDTLLAGGFAGNSGVIINDLTIANANITSSNALGYGAFINCIDSMPMIELNNCHLKNSKITDTKGARVGGLIGWSAGYNNPNDGPVDTYITITNCSVTGCEITAAGSVGAIIGHAGNNPATYHTITNCTVKYNKLVSNDDSYRVGAIVGTANVGEVTITGCTSEGNTYLQNNNGTEIARPAGQSDLYGRFVPGDNGKLTIDGTEIN